MMKTEHNKIIGSVKSIEGVATATNWKGEVRELHLQDELTTRDTVRVKKNSTLVILYLSGIEHVLHGGEIYSLDPELRGARGYSASSGAYGDTSKNESFSRGGELFFIASTTSIPIASAANASSLYAALLLYGAVTAHKYNTSFGLKNNSDDASDLTDNSADVGIGGGEYISVLGQESFVAPYIIEQKQSGENIDVFMGALRAPLNVESTEDLEITTVDAESTEAETTASIEPAILQPATTSESSEDSTSAGPGPVVFTVSGDPATNGGSLGASTANYTVSYTGQLDPGEQASVRVATANGNARLGSDFNSLTPQSLPAGVTFTPDPGNTGSGTLTFTGGLATSVTFTVNTINNNTNAGNTTFQVLLSDPSPSTFVDNGIITTTIDNGNPAITIASATSNGFILSDSGGLINVHIRAGNGSEISTNPVTITLPGTAELISASTPGTLTFSGSSGGNSSYDFIPSATTTDLQLTLKVTPAIGNPYIAISVSATQLDTAPLFGQSTLPIDSVATYPVITIFYNDFTVDGLFTSNEIGQVGVFFLFGESDDGTDTRTASVELPAGFIMTSIAPSGTLVTVTTVGDVQTIHFTITPGSPGNSPQAGGLIGIQAPNNIVTPIAPIILATATEQEGPQPVGAPTNNDFFSTTVQAASGMNVIGTVFAFQQNDQHDVLITLINPLNPYQAGAQFDAANLKFFGGFNNTFDTGFVVGAATPYLFSTEATTANTEVITSLSINLKLPVDNFQLSPGLLSLTLGTDGDPLTVGAYTWIIQFRAQPSPNILQAATPSNEGDVGLGDSFANFTYLYGNGSDNTIHYGGSSPVILNGGLGADSLQGGSGMNVFVLNNDSFNLDLSTLFNNSGTPISFANQDTIIGGSGFNILRIDWGAMVNSEAQTDINPITTAGLIPVDLTMAGGQVGSLSNIQEILITQPSLQQQVGVGTQLTLTAADVLSIAGSTHNLTIIGGNGDVIRLTDGTTNWVDFDGNSANGLTPDPSLSFTNSGRTFDVYHSVPLGPGLQVATLEIPHEVSVIVG